MAINLNREGVQLNGEERNKRNQNWEILEKSVADTQGDIENIAISAGTQAFNQVVDAAKLNWKAPVTDFADLSTTYPQAIEGDASQTISTGSVYRFNGSVWDKIQQIDAGPVNEVDARLTAQLAEKASQEELDMVGVNATNFGAVGNEINDDTEALNNLADSIRGTDNVLFIPRGNFRITDTVDFRGIKNVDMVGSIVADFNGIAIMAGGYADTRMNDACLNLRVRKASVDWTEENTGIELINIYNSRGFLESYNFKRNLILKGAAPSNACAYNTFQLGKMINGEISLTITTAGATGWCNENLFIGGNMGCEIQGSIAPILITSEAATANLYPNHNVFIKTNFEYIYSQVSGVIFDKALDNHLYNVRIESPNPLVAKFEGISNNNTLNIGNVSSTKPQWEDNTTSQNVKNFVNVLLGDTLGYRSILETKSFLSAYTDGVDTHIPGFEILGVGSNPNTSYRKISSVQIVKNDKGITIPSFSRAVGLRIDTTNAKNFLVNSSPIEGFFTPSYIVLCYDKFGNILSGENPYYVQGRRKEVVYTDFYRFRGGAVLNLLFHDDVKSAFIGVTASTSGVSGVGGIDILVSNLELDTVKSWLGYSGIKESPNKRYSFATPTGGTWEKGAIIYNENPAAGGFIGWICVTAGTPGSWKQFGSINA